MKLIPVSLLAIAFSGHVCSALAHHSFAAEFERRKPITLQGVVSKVEWQNPHTRLYLNVPDQSGAVVKWELELASPNALMRAGWTRRSVQVGDSVTVRGFLAKDGSRLANAATVTTSNGRTVLSVLSSADAPAPPAK